MENVPAINEQDQPYSLLQSFGGSEELMLHAIAQAMSAYPAQDGIESQMKIGKELLETVQPKDPVESRLHLMQHVSFARGMDYLNKADSAPPQHRESFANLGLKLLRLCNESAQTLKNYQRGPNQTICVEHIEKAVISDVGGGSRSRKIGG